ncbi:MAG TPA: hypothetical protein VFA33_05935 [Bryobacteraceae bacterium]|nr:hypothetical protein [Bryobacteraceae bacterium]
MAGEPLTIFDPRRNFQLQGFTGRAATTTLHDATATGVSISGIFQAAEDFAVLGLYNAYDYFNHLRQKHLPRTDLSGLTLEFDIEYNHDLDGAMRLDAAKYPSVSWDAMTFVCGKGGPGEIREVKLLSYASVVSGGETPASVSVELSGTQADEGLDHVAIVFRDTEFDCVPWGKLYALPRSLSAPNGTIDLWASDLDPVTGELELKVGDTVYFTYDPIYLDDPPYALEEICHVTAIDPVYKNRVTFDNTLPHGGPATCRTYNPGPFAITAGANDTLTFIIDGTPIYVGLTAGPAQTSAQVAAGINTAFIGAGLAATADVTDDGCVRVTSTKPVGEGEINMYGGTAQSTIQINVGVYAGAGPQWHVHGLATAESAAQNLADSINGNLKNTSRTGPDQSGVIQATASGKTITIAFKTSAPPATVMGKLGNGEILSVRSFHETVPEDEQFDGYDPAKDVQGVTFGANRSIRFRGGDNDTKYHIALPLGALTDKNGDTVPTVDCRKVYMVFAPRFEIVEEALEDGCFLTAPVDPGDTTWSVDSGASLTGGRYFIGDESSEERILLVAGGATSIQVQRGYESSTPGSWPAGTRLKKLPPISGFQSDVEWGATISNIAVTGDASLKVGGDSERIEDTDKRCVFTGYWEEYKYNTGWPSQWWSMGHAKRTGPSNEADVRSVTIKYSATEGHDLYLGTFLYTNCGKIRVEVDGAETAESPLDLYLDEYGGTTANVKVASGVAAGNHTVVITALYDRNAASLGYYLYFDYLWPLVAQDVPDPQKEYPDVSLAIDFDTDHGYRKPPAWHLWHLQKLGFRGHADVYMGVFWNNKRRRVGASYPYAAIEYSLGEGHSAPRAGDVVVIQLSGSAMRHTVLDGESLQDIVNGMRVLINQFSGVWADDNYGSSSTLRIQSKAPSWAYGDIRVLDGAATIGGAVNEPFDISAGVNDGLVFTFGGGPVATVTLTAGASRTGAEVAADIQTAFDAAGVPATARPVSFGQIWVESQTDVSVDGTACDVLGFFPGSQGLVNSVRATLTDHLGTPGDEGDWELIDSVSPVMTEGARKWIKDLATEFAAAGILASFAFSMEIYNPPAPMRAKYLHRAGGVVTPGDDVFLEVPSYQMHFGARVRNYLKQMYKECADQVAAAGLPVALQFGETQWWYFDNRQADVEGGMPFYDQETIDAFAAAKGHQIWPFLANTDDPAGDPAHPKETADFLRDRIWSYCQEVIAYVRASHPAAVFECLWPLDANQGRLSPANLYRKLLMHVNLPEQWKSSSYGIKYFRCEGFDYDVWNKNVPLMRATMSYGAQVLGRPASECMYLAGLYGPPDPPMAQAYGQWLTAPYYSMCFWAFDQYCLNSRPNPLEVWMQSPATATVYHKPRVARAVETPRAVVVTPPAAGALNRFKLNERKLSG